MYICYEENNKARNKQYQTMNRILYRCISNDWIASNYILCSIFPESNNILLAFGLFVMYVVFKYKLNHTSFVIIHFLPIVFFLSIFQNSLKWHFQLSSFGFKILCKMFQQFVKRFNSRDISLIAFKDFNWISKWFVWNLNCIGLDLIFTIYVVHT